MADPNSSARDSSGRPPFRWLIVILLLAVVIRLVMMWLRPADLQSDPDNYVTLGETILESGGFNKPGSDIPTAYRPPLYPFLLSTLFSTGMAVPNAVGVINLFATVIVIIVAWQLGRILELPRWAVILAAATAAFDPLLLRYSLLPMTEVLSAALLSVALLPLFGILAGREVISRRDEIRSAVFCGVCFGVAGMCRPVVLANCGLMCFTLFCFFWRDNRSTLFGGSWPRLRIVPLIAAGAAIVLMPWVIRNAICFGTFVPATTHGGYTLLLGNNDVFYSEVVQSSDNNVWDGQSLQAWQLQLQEQIDAAGISSADEPRVDRWMYAQALSAIREQPFTFLRACCLRWRRFWAPVPTAATGGFPRAFQVLTFCWYVIVGLGLMGSLFCGNWRRRDIQILWLAILSFLLIHTFYWTNTRMRGPLTGVFSVLSVAGWRNWIRSFVKR